MGRLLLLFVVLPAVELALLIQVGGRIGTVNTLALIVVTGVLGASLARREGLGVLRQIEGEIAEGRLPAGSLVDGVIILLAAALLVTPGVLTDAAGLLCLVPGFRALCKRVLWRRLERAVSENRAHLWVDLEAQREGGERVVYQVREDGEPVLRRPPQP